MYKFLLRTIFLLILRYRLLVFKLQNEKNIHVLSLVSRNGCVFHSFLFQEKVSLKKEWIVEVIRGHVK